MSSSPKRDVERKRRASGGGGAEHPQKKIKRRGGDGGDGCTIAWKSSACAEEVAEVKKMLGYAPSNFHSVAKRCCDIKARACSENHPAAIRLYPIVDHTGKQKRKQRAPFEPFPTLYWLTCETLKKEVSKLEGEGRIKEYAAKLAGDEALAKQLAMAQDAYRTERWSLLVEDDKRAVEARGWADRLKSLGVASCSRLTEIKCLHAHLAHHLGSGKNIVGKWTLEALEE